MMEHVSIKAIAGICTAAFLVILVWRYFLRPNFFPKKNRKKSGDKGSKSKGADDATRLMRLKYSVLSNSIRLVVLLVVGGIICLCVGWRPFDGTHHDSKDYANTELRSGVFVDWSVSVTTPAEAETLHPKQPNGGFRAPLQGTRLLHRANKDFLHVQRKNCSNDTIYFECWWEDRGGRLHYFPNGGRFAWLPGTDLFPYGMVLPGTTHLEGWVIRKDPSIDGSATLQVRI